MKVVALIFIAIGFAITALSNLAVFYGLRTAMLGMQDSAASGIGEVAWGMNLSYICSFISLFGCFILFVGVIFSIISLFVKKRA